MAERGVQGLPRDVPSVALDRLFLEIREQLPREARGKLAQLADEMKKRRETSTADAPESQPSSADQAVVRREEGTIEAKQSSADLQARGEVYNTRSRWVFCGLNNVAVEFRENWISWLSCPKQYQKWTLYSWT